MSVTGKPLWRNRSARALGLAAAVLVLCVAFVASIALGITPISPDNLIAAFFHYDAGNTQQIILRDERAPRAIIASLVGASLAVAGALMQALTRNALASPSILGINAGAMFFLICGAAFFGLQTPLGLVSAAFLGSGIAAALVYMLALRGRGSLSPIRLILAGVAITALFVSFSQGLLIINQERFASMLFWLAGSVSGRQLSTVWPLLPLFLVAVALCLLLPRHLNAMVLDDDVVKGLGQRTDLVRALVGITVILLAGTSVALAGMIGFIGLIVPHIVRRMFGMDHRWVLPACALFGAILLLIADTLARFVIPPQEVPVGVMTALLGTPFFIILACRTQQTL